MAGHAKIGLAILMACAISHLCVADEELIDLNVYDGSAVTELSGSANQAAVLGRMQSELGEEKEEEKKTEETEENAAKKKAKDAAEEPAEKKKANNIVEEAAEKKRADKLKAEAAEAAEKKKAKDAAEAEQKKAAEAAAKKQEAEQKQANKLKAEAEARKAADADMERMKAEQVKEAAKKQEEQQQAKETAKKSVAKENEAKKQSKADKLKADEAAKKKSEASEVAAKATKVKISSKIPWGEAPSPDEDHPLHSFASFTSPEVECAKLLAPAAPAKEAAPSVCKLSMAGNPKLLDKHPKECSKADSKLAVRCCKDGKEKLKMTEKGQGQGPAYGCNKDKTYAEASSICKEKGYRLCSAEEMKAGKAQGTGCDYDGRRVWTSSSQGHAPELEELDGIGRSGAYNGLFIPGNCLKKEADPSQTQKTTQTKKVWIRAGKTYRSTNTKRFTYSGATEYVLDLTCADAPGRSDLKKLKEYGSKIRLRIEDYHCCTCDGSDFEKAPFSEKACGDKHYSEGCKNAKGDDYCENKAPKNICTTAEGIGECTKTCGRCPHHFAKCAKGCFEVTKGCDPNKDESSCTPIYSYSSEMFTIVHSKESLRLHTQKEADAIEDKLLAAAEKKKQEEAAATQEKASKKKQEEEKVKEAATKKQEEIEKAKEAATKETAVKKQQAARAEKAKEQGGFLANTKADLARTNQAGNGEDFEESFLQFDAGKDEAEQLEEEKAKTAAEKEHKNQEKAKEGAEKERKSKDAAAKKLEEEQAKAAQDEAEKQQKEKAKAAEAEIKKAEKIKSDAAIAEIKKAEQGNTPAGQEQQVVAHKNPKDPNETSFPTLTNSLPHKWLACVADAIRQKSLPWQKRNAAVSISQLVAPPQPKQVSFAEHQMQAGLLGFGAVEASTWNFGGADRAGALTYS